MATISFTPVVDGATATAASVNTPLSTIVNDYNGNITDANISASAAIAGSKISVASLGFGATVLTQANAGTAGGTFSYINLGGVKMLWINTGALTSTIATNTYTFTLPTSFFSTLTSVSATLGVLTNTSIQAISVASQSAATITILLYAGSNGSSATTNLFVIGT